MPESRARQRKHLATDMARLERRLRQLCRDRLTPGEKARLRVLDLACGECFEAEMLSRFLRRIAVEEGRGPEDLQVEFVGADIREREIGRAAERCGSGIEGVDFRFLVKDGQKLRGDGEVGEDFDFVFVRHQNFYLGGQEWHRLFEESLEKLAPKGKLVITSYFDREHALATNAIQRVGGELIEDLANREARALPTEGKFVDKRLAIFRRGKGSQGIG